MIPQTKLDRMDKQVRAFLAKQFVDRQASLAELTALWSLYRDLRLPNDDFIAELTNGKSASLAQRTWEMLLAQHLHDEGHALTCLGHGPDLKFEHGGKTIWVEATAPEPSGLPPDWLSEPAPGESKSGRFPHEEILLRFTTAFDAKWQKLGVYRSKDKEIVKPGDSYVIAINGCQLGWIPGGRGITQYPFGVETVFPVGPLAMRLNKETRKVEETFVSERFAILNKNNSPIETTRFLDPQYAGISALICCTTDRRRGKPLPVHVVHNPLATNPVPHGLLGGRDDEWFATPIDGAPGEFYLQQVDPPDGIRAVS